MIFIFFYKCFVNMNQQSRRINTVHIVYPCVSQKCVCALPLWSPKMCMCSTPVFRNYVYVPYPCSSQECVSALPLWSPGMSMCLNPVVPWNVYMPYPCGLQEYVCAHPLWSPGIYMWPHKGFWPIWRWRHFRQKSGRSWRTVLRDIFSQLIFKYSIK